MKKRKILIIVLVVLVILVASVVIAVSILGGNYEKRLSNAEIEEQIDDMIDKSYQFYLLKNGPLEVEDGYVQIGDETYYSVNLEGITSLEDIENLIDSLFVERMRAERYGDIFNGDRQYVEVGENLYVKMDDNICELDYTLDKNNYEYTSGENNMLSLSIGNFVFNLEKENDHYYTSVSFYNCKIEE